MSDKELLELAAKAGGIHAVHFHENFYQEDGKAWAERIEGSCWKYWSPLHDDSDALRLAVKFPHINVSYIIMAAHQQNEMDPCAYLRREITKAVAEIGRML